MDADHARALLARERSRIEDQLKGLEPPPDDELSNLDQHPGDAGTEVFEEERDAGIADRLREELDAIGRAERRVEEGTYGVSMESGEPIPDDRLEAVPWTDRTVEEQSRLERGGGRP
jgi:RNA polymerase-binding transcription factor DksA